MNTTKEINLIYNTINYANNALKEEEAEKGIILVDGAFKQSNNREVCPHCGSKHISTKNNGAGRKNRIAKNILIEPLTCDDCGAAITRFYIVIGMVGDSFGLRYIISNSINNEYSAN